MEKNLFVTSLPTNAGRTFFEEGYFIIPEDAIVLNLKNKTLCPECTKNLQELLKQYPNVLSKDGVEAVKSEPAFIAIQNCCENKKIAKCFQGPSDFQGFGTSPAAKEISSNPNNPRFAGCLPKDPYPTAKGSNCIGEHVD